MQDLSALLTQVAQRGHGAHRVLAAAAAQAAAVVDEELHQLAVEGARLQELSEEVVERADEAAFELPDGQDDVAYSHNTDLALGIELLRDRLNGLPLNREDGPPLRLL